MSELQLLVSKIAPLLGAGWKAVEPNEGGDWRSFAEGPGEMRLFFTNSWGWGPKGMLHVSGSYPANYYPRQNGNSDRASINVSLTKSPEQIARDIQRRLLPVYAELLAEVLKTKQATEEHEAKCRALLVKLAKVYGVEPPTRNGDHDRHSLYLEHGTLEVNGESVSFKLYSVKPETAERILELLRGEKEAEPKEGA